MSLFRLALESSRQPLAVVIKGNPKYLHDPKVAAAASKFYDEIRSILEGQGYRVSFDYGYEYTHPDKRAAVWVAHSRGIDRLRFAPETVKTLALQTRSHGKSYDSMEAEALDPDHYRLSNHDLLALRELKA